MRRLPVRLFISSILTLILAGLPHPLRANEMVVIPSVLDLAVRPGKKLQGTIVVKGAFDQPTRIRAYAGDWGMNPGGNLVFLAPGIQPRSLARWLSIAPLEFLLGKGRTQIVRYQLQVPAEAVGSYWGVLFFEAAPFGKVQKDAVGVRTAIRLTSLICASIEQGGVSDGRITDISARYLGGRMTFTAGFANLGNLIARVGGRFELRNQQTGKVTARIPLEPVLVLPGGTRTITANWQGRLPGGEYVPVFYADYGREDMRQGPIVKVNG